jgi:acyl-CoA synthetase (AMP-forming)/AMP-acid ligase II
LSGVDIRILDENHLELPTGQPGQIFAKSSSHFDEYTSGTTKHLFEGYMASGDLGYFDGSGRLFVVGRDDEMIVSGGENVYPIEVERVLADHPLVVEAAVLGVDDERFGQRLVAFVVPKRDTSITPDLLMEHVKDQLANYKVPREITVLDELPRTSTGKILRRELQSRVTPS